jgi:uncharacterized protein
MNVGALTLSRNSIMKNLSYHSQQSGSRKNALVIFVRAPVAGKVKTRLACSIGDEQALKIYYSLARQTIETGRACKVNLIIAYYPEEQYELAKAAFGKGAYLAQSGNDLGERMQNSFLNCLARGFEKIIIIGSDIPGLDVPIIKNSFQKLDYYDCVIGPARDGGFYLIGLTAKGFVKDFYKNIAWGTKVVYSQILSVFAEHSISVFSLDELIDIDTEEDLFECAYSCDDFQKGV